MSIHKSNSIGIKIPNILLPAENVNLKRWSVVACDQFTSQPNYWDDVYEYVGEDPSTLKIIFPEVFLNSENPDAINMRIDSINSNMEAYLSDKILTDIGPCFIYLQRQFSNGNTRNGLILSVDLEQYNFDKDSTSLIRATEGTVLDRIPPRMKVRKNASLESPHIMLLIDDPNHTVIEPLADATSSYKPVYNFDLMMDSGHMTGYKIDDERLIDSIIYALSDLADENTFNEKYNLSSNQPPMLFAVGDGNHSLATAKGHWDQLKKTLTLEEQETHPARFALVEVVNIHDKGLIFEPIHRVVFNIDPDELLNKMQDYFIAQNSTINVKNFDSISEAESYATTKWDSTLSSEVQFITFCSSNSYGVIEINNPPHTLEVGSLQNFLDQYETPANKSEKVVIDYIHGSDVVADLSAKDNTIGFLLPVMNKNDFFNAIVKQGSLPRKTFSMGDASDKRFYMECKKIL